ncbi:hypothetical protein Taro_020359 [Colocasia esculenta]|uniref:Uncharacterized protein n=1 Tax=Colocasia esculenta TaxID=4460 RepID=A0A843UZD5_COLES|nr:hypothetical protein [Colocasia esculenta]
MLYTCSIANVSRFDILHRDMTRSLKRLIRLKQSQPQECEGVDSEERSEVDLGEWVFPKVSSAATMEKVEYNAEKEHEKKEELLRSSKEKETLEMTIGELDGYLLQSKERCVELENR